MTTTIKVREKTKMQLDKLKIHPRESYDEVIRKLARVKIDHEPLSKEALESIAKANEDIKKGRVYTEAEVRRRLGL